MFLAGVVEGFFSERIWLEDDGGAMFFERVFGIEGWLIREDPSSFVNHCNSLIVGRRSTEDEQ